MNFVALTRCHNAKESLFAPNWMLFIIFEKNTLNYKAAGNSVPPRTYIIRSCLCCFNVSGCELKWAGLRRETSLEFHAL